MGRLSLLLLTLVAVACLLVAGCGKIRQATEAAKALEGAQTGNYTVTNDKGEKTTVETKPGEAGSGKVTTQTPGGTQTTEVGANKVKAEDVGIDFYPGATVDQGMTTSTTGDKGSQAASAMLSTTDSFAKVAKFYKDKYGTGNTVMEQPTSLMITITAGKGAGKMIMVSTEDGKTKIMITAAMAM